MKINKIRIEKYVKVGETLCNTPLKAATYYTIQSNLRWAMKKQLEFTPAANHLLEARAEKLFDRVKPIFERMF